ncbi:alpha/beta fold hydrolase [Demequina globuliformis]|uniref:alpha/beta fold hydrolase n=1 Tax=Demequina globuliformis TaxID=676202 RepID=UPI0007845502|nr:alpha/beta hydrolase [Demequina globuliformis]
MRTRLDEARYREAERALWAAYGLEPREHWVTVPSLGIRVRVLECGAGVPGTAALFVHGTPTAGGVFASLVAALQAGGGRRCLVLDRPGCALSDPLPVGSLGADAGEAIAAVLGAVAGELGDGPVHVVGNSAGGMAAIQFAARRPAQVASVVLDGVPAVAGMTLPAPMRLATLRPVAGVVSRWRVSERDFVRSLRGMGHGALIDRGGLTREQLDWRVALANHTDTYAHEFALLRAFASVRGLRPGWAPDASVLARVEAPSLWIVGERDPFGRADAVARWAAHVSRSRVEVRPGEGHQPWLDAPADHADLFHSFWKNRDS